MLCKHTPLAIIELDVFQISWATGLLVDQAHVQTTQSIRVTEGQAKINEINTLAFQQAIANKCSMMIMSWLGLIRFFFFTKRAKILVRISIKEWRLEHLPFLKLSKRGLKSICKNVCKIIFHKIGDHAKG
jgi:hypothetical protein